MSLADDYPIGFGLTRQELDLDLHALTSRLRSDEPITWLDEVGGWYITRRETVVNVLSDAETFTVEDDRFAVKQVLGANMLGVDGEEHTRHRVPFDPGFKMSSVRSLVPAIDAMVRGLLDELPDAGRLEVRADVATPIAVGVVHEMLGLTVDPEVLHGWYDEIVVAMTEASNGKVNSDARPQGVDRLGEDVARVVNGRSELLSEVARSLPLADVSANAAVILFGGIETSETMTASALAQILTHPSTDRILADPKVLARAIDEALRLEPPVIQIDRFLTRDAVVEGVGLKKGDYLICSVAGANRDPSFYPNPDTFDPDRTNARTHVSFAKGPHTCIGMHLARLETRSVIEQVCGRLPSLRLANEPVWSGSVFRRPSEVIIEWG